MELAVTAGIRFLKEIEFPCSKLIVPCEIEFQFSLRWTNLKLIQLVFCSKIICFKNGSLKNVVLNPMFWPEAISTQDPMLNPNSSPAPKVFDSEDLFKSQNPLVVVQATWRSGSRAMDAAASNLGFVWITPIKIWVLNHSTFSRRWPLC